MLKDITLGQFFPGNSIVHRLDPRFKLVLMMVMMVVLVMIQRAIPLTLMFVFVAAAVAASKISLKLIMRSLRPLLIMVLFTSLLNIFFTPGREIWRIWFFRITYEGIVFSVVMAVRITLLIAGTSLLTYTTSPIMLTEAIERLLSPLKKIGAPVGELAMMMTIALRFIPTLLDETERIMAAQKARGADLESGNMLKRIRAFVPVLVPVFVGALKRADELALAMESRCYRGGNERTSMKVLKASRLDFEAAGVCCVFFVGVIALIATGV